MSDSRQGSLTMQTADRASYNTPDGEREHRRQQIGESPFCRNPSPVETEQQLDHPPDCCQHCGGKVTEQYRRVLGDQDDIAHHCPDCPDVSQRERFAGLAADPDRDVKAARGGGGTGVATDGGNHR